MIESNNTLPYSLYYSEPNCCLIAFLILILVNHPLSAHKFLICPALYLFFASTQEDTSVYFQKKKNKLGNSYMGVEFN